MQSNQNPSPRKSQLNKLASIFDSCSLNYWIDSGTLLGIIRDGNLLPSDEDIDISTHINNINQLQKVLNSVSKLGYKIEESYHQGLPYKYTLHPAKDDYSKVDIKLFRGKNKFIWCPAFPGRFPDSRASKIVRGAYAGARFVSFKYLKIIKMIARDRDSILFKPSLLGTQPMTWIYPKQYIFPTQTRDRKLVPNNIETYLKYRYGDWKTPTDDWNFVRDDGGLIKEKPEDALRRVKESTIKI